MNTRRSLVSSCYLTKIPSQSTIYTRHPTNSCVPKFFQPDPDRWIIMDDFNTHSQAGAMMILIIKEMTGSSHTIWCSSAPPPPAFYSRAWRTTSCPELALATDDVAKITSREVDKQLGGSDHKPIFLTIERHKTPPEIYQSPNWNFSKANWEVFKRYQPGTTSP